MDLSKAVAAGPAGETPHVKCAARLKSVLKNDERVHKLVDAIEALGCSIPDGFFSCRPCPGNVSGGFLVDQNAAGDSAARLKTPYQPKIVMCENDCDQTTFDNTVVHELVHAYDQCKQKIDWTNCLHHACTEIRASSISGECDFRQEVNRGRYQIARGGLDCVQRRAVLSVSSNPHCKDVAKDAVLATWDFCSREKAPMEQDGPV